MKSLTFYSSKIECLHQMNFYTLNIFLLVSATVNMARENSDFVIGFISQSKLTSDPTFIHMTPGEYYNAVSYPFPSSVGSYAYHIKLS